MGKIKPSLLDRFTDIKNYDMSIELLENELLIKSTLGLNAAIPSDYLDILQGYRSDFEVFKSPENPLQNKLDIMDRKTGLFLSVPFDEALVNDISARYHKKLGYYMS